MNHRMCARGIAAASIALASTTASAAPPVPTFADGLPGVESAGRISAGLDNYGLTGHPAKDTEARDWPSWVANGAATKSPREPKSIRNPVHRPLDDLVRDHSEVFPMDEERLCLAGTIYFEARGEPLEGQLAVAEVVLNRAASGEYPASICEVVKQPAQFSFVRDRRFPPIDERTSAWGTAVAVAHIATEQLADKLATDVLWYHADYVAPGWGRRLDRVTKIGAHIFYRRG